MKSPPDPVAVVGIGCRFAAGIDSPASLWRFLMDGRVAAGDIPDHRWEDYARDPRTAAVLRRTTARGSFIPDIAGFDAEFFGIPPREARLIDPQHRLAMEVAWEALEHAGIPPGTLAGSDTAVFVGIGSDDYGRRLLEDLPGIEAWTGIGASMCAAANRISHALDLRGPSVAIDTACSASLVAIHQAALSLLHDDVPLALAGGVMLMAGPGLAVALDAAGATSPDGRSKPFDAAADGYGRGEGCGFVVLQRLSAARRDGNRVLALLRGGAVRQDGRTDGIMAPSGSAQEHLLRQAYRTAGVDPATVGYVEAHGTGTRAGDPVEAGALAAVIGGARPSGQPCLVGSVKANIGHLEAAAGAAGLIKAVLAVERAVIPPTPAVAGPHPGIPWHGSGLALVDTPTPWPAGRSPGHPRRAGVAGYGYGGTIAHLVVEQAPATERDSRGRQDSGHSRPRPAAGPRMYPVSGRGADAVTANAGRLRDWLLAHPAAELADVGHTLALRRSHLAHRAVVIAEDRAELLDGLSAVTPVRAQPDLGDPVWVFSGHGAQWPGMCRDLLAQEPRFAEVLDKLEAVYRHELGRSPREILTCDEPLGVDLVQASIFAVQLGLSALWRSYGLRPAAVIGHSVGEITAAVVAGVLDADDGAQLACRRARLLRRVAGRGAMAMVPLPFAEAERALADDPRVSAAIEAGPGTTVVSGMPAALTRAIERWAGQGLTVRRVNSDVAFHSAQMEPLCAQLARAAADLRVDPPAVPLYSTALGDPRSPAARDAGYWVTNLRAPVRFATAVAAAVDDGHRAFLEISTHPVVAQSIADCSPSAVVAYSLRRDRPARRCLLENLAALYRRGAPVDWSMLHTDGDLVDLVDLPTYAWQHERHWAEHSPAATGGTGAGHDPASHTLLGTSPFTVHGPVPTRVWRTHLDHGSRPYPGDHPVAGSEIVPAAVLLNTFLRAAGTRALREVSLLVPVATAPAREIQVTCQDASLRLSSSVDGAWLTHTVATVDTDRPVRTAAPAPSAGTHVDPGFVTDRLAALGVTSMGLPWRVTRLRRHDGPSAASSATPSATLFAVVTAGDGPPDGRTSWATVLDAVLSTASVVFPGPPVLRMPARIGRLALAVDEPPAEVAFTVRVRGTGTDGGTSGDDSGDDRDGDRDTVDVDVSDRAGRPVAVIRALRFGTPEGPPRTAAHLLHEVAWQPLEPAAGPASITRVATLSYDPGLAALLAGRGGPAGPGLLGQAGGPGAIRLVTGPGTADAVVFTAWPQAGEEPADAVVRLAGRLRTVLREHPTARIWCVTHGARAAEDATGLAQTALWGLGRIAAGEYPDRWGGLVDLPADPSAADIAVLAGLLGQRRDEDVIAIADGRAEATRLVPAAGTAAGGPRCRPDGTYLITGGTGALGRRVARWLAARGARRLLLL
uniref:type I polyketide synthase n=1 Tax=Frankia sp. CiP1_Cm_nod2 TaxID=2897161 RepID=UPI0020257FF2